MVDSCLIYRFAREASLGCVGGCVCVCGCETQVLWRDILKSSCTQGKAESQIHGLRCLMSIISILDDTGTLGRWEPLVRKNHEKPDYPLVI